MILAFQSSEQAFGCCFAAGGGLLISIAFLDWVWQMTHRTAAPSRWLGAIAMGWLGAHS